MGARPLPHLLAAQRNVRRSTLHAIMFARLALALVFVLVTGCAAVPAQTPDAAALSIVELPRPNSGTFTFEQANARRPEIYSLARSGMKPDWTNKYPGFAVHVTADDKIVVYCCGCGFGGGEMSVSQLSDFLDGYRQRLRGNALGVLITSEIAPADSRALAQVVALLFQPSVQLYYCKRA